MDEESRASQAIRNCLEQHAVKTKYFHHIDAAKVAVSLNGYIDLRTILGCCNYKVARSIVVKFSDRMIHFDGSIFDSILIAFMVLMKPDFQVRAVAFCLRRFILKDVCILQLRSENFCAVCGCSEFFVDGH